MMTIGASLERVRTRFTRPRLRRARDGRVRVARGTPLPPLSPRLQLARALSIIVLVLTVSLLLHLVLTSRLQHGAAQERHRDHFRAQLANGTAPIGPNDSAGKPLELGTSVALLEIRAIGLSEVVGEGTSAAVLYDGPGHRRDTPLPGQVGSSVMFGRRLSFGGPFARIGELEPGDEIEVTTGQGHFVYRVRGVRHEGDPVPDPIEPGSARLTLATAAGNPFLPDGVLRVDADIDGTPVGGAGRTIAASALPKAEQAMGIDTRTLWALALWLQALTVAVVAAIWSWHRWSRPHTWVVFVPLLLLIGLATAGEATRLLPNMS